MAVIPSDLFVQFIEQGIKKGFLNNIVKTLDGEHYLHEDYVQNSISNSVKKYGKTTIEKLAEELCIEQEHVKKILNTTVTSNEWTIVDDLVLTQKYVNDITSEIKSQIQENGYISIISQTQQMKLPYSLLKSIIVSIDDDDYVRFTQIPDFVATKNYIAESKSNIMNDLKTLDEPYQIFKLQKTRNIQEDLFYLLLEQIIKDNSSLGLLRGKKSRAIFEPKSYKQRQLTLIKSIFDSNECISVNTIESLYSFISPSDLIADNYAKDQYLKLHSCFIKYSIKDKAKSAVESAKSYCDVNEVLPVNLTFEDVTKVVDIIMSEFSANNSKKFVVLEGGYLAKSEYIQKLATESNSYLRNLSRSIKQKQNKNHSVNANLSDNDIIKAFESIGCPHNIAEKVVPFTRNSMATQFDELLQTPYVETDSITSGDKWINNNKSRELEKLSNLRQSIYFNYQAMKLFKDKSSKKNLEKYILKNQCMEYLFHLVIYLVLDQSFNKTEVSQSTSLCITLEDIENQSIVDTKQQKYAISYFVRENDHKYDNTSIVEIETLIKNKDLDQLVTKFLIQDKQNIYKDTNITSEESAKKANEMTHLQLYNQLRNISVTVDTAPQILHLVSLLIFQKLYQLPLYVSGKFVPSILDQIKPLLSQEEQDLLHTVHMLVVGNNRADGIKSYTTLKEIGIKRYD